MAEIETENATKPHTIAFYKGRLKAMLRHDIAKLKLDEIEAADIKNYKNARRLEGAAVSTRNRELATLRKILNLAADSSKLISKPVEIKLDIKN